MLDKIVKFSLSLCTKARMLAPKLAALTGDCILQSLASTDFSSMQKLQNMYAKDLQVQQPNTFVTLALGITFEVMCCKRQSKVKGIFNYVYCFF